ncbi:radical SAM protein [Mechercharimyces sp. CAU 1602]|uniref:7-carboxy-7-deazaguanine synthase QueE n=1 Tax=Mechercharimyces sp. CAU 1602 TaxID=2973933 RepID=UPI002161C124|nr:radical SAM protein [Mechercharimyces sp. CAU 1602]MCS1351582.1 radical SAM protein [Mechercharimyces sp. CAU 1602]
MSTLALETSIPMVEIFETVEGEGLKTGYPTTFIRLYNCNLRCTWCDTPYSYAPHKPEYTATVTEIMTDVDSYQNRYICLTGGEPLLYTEKALILIQQLAERPYIEDIHIETNGAIDLTPFHQWRIQHPQGDKVRFIMDFKLSKSGERTRMLMRNFEDLLARDEVKFVISDREDFVEALETVTHEVKEGEILFSPEWTSLSPQTLVEWMLASNQKQIRLNLQTHKYIWHPDQRGV